VRSLLSNSKLRDVDAVRLVMLYALRYEKHTNNDISGLIGVLQRRNLPDKLIKVAPLRSDVDWLTCMSYYTAC